MIGIYIITNEINKKVYIGLSKDILDRLNNRHLVALRKNKHGNKRLQRSFNKHKEENFTFNILELCEENKLSEHEIYWINFYKSYNPEYGYNKTFGGEGFGIFTEETRKKLSNSHKGKTPRKGYKTTDETKLKMSESHMGHTTSEETKEKLRNKFKGIPLSEECKNNLSKSLKGKTAGNKNGRWIEVTQEMIEDYKKNPKNRASFLIKYPQVSGTIWYKIRKIVGY